MLPYATILSLDRKAAHPLYLQVCGQLIQAISDGVIPTGLRLPGSRSLGDQLGLSRKTINLAYEELEAQGWVEILPRRGVFVSRKLPRLKRVEIAGGDRSKVTGRERHRSAFPLPDHLDFLRFFQPPEPTPQLRIDTGYPDGRLAPRRELSQAFHAVVNGRGGKRIMDYADDFRGHPDLIRELLRNLAATRGITAGPENIFISRGSLMAFSTIFSVLLRPGDRVVTGDLSFQVANNIIRIAGGVVETVPVDQEGLDVDAIERRCQAGGVRAVFVMPHHHHPTTVSLSAARRMKLLHLAERYGFAIIEDDYDYDFHYDSGPILPMASIDRSGTVIYVGSFSKTLIPGLRIGYIMAPADLIDRIARLSRFLDCHGNTALEKALARLFREGVIGRHLKKSLKTYRNRRDWFCHRLREDLGEVVQFSEPEGGLAVWVRFDPKVALSLVREKALQSGLLISRTVFRDADGEPINAIRMGFASLDEEEIDRAIGLLSEVVRGI